MFQRGLNPKQMFVSEWKWKSLPQRRIFQRECELTVAVGFRFGVEKLFSPESFAKLDELYLKSAVEAKNERVKSIFVAFFC